MRFAVFLFSLFAVTTGFLIWRRIPRPLVFAILWMSATIYALSFFVGLQIVDRVNQELIAGFVPYSIPARRDLYRMGMRRHYRAVEQERTPTAFN